MVNENPCLILILSEKLDDLKDVFLVQAVQVLWSWKAGFESVLYIGFLKSGLPFFSRADAAGCMFSLLVFYYFVYHQRTHRSKGSHGLAEAINVL